MRGERKEVKCSKREDKRADRPRKEVNVRTNRRKQQKSKEKYRRRCERERKLKTKRTDEEN